MADPILLYSTNTWLAYIIAQRFYKGERYVWCTPFFDPRSLATYDTTVPPTSSPSEIYRNLDAEVRRGDRHSAKIKENRTGILRGANYKRASGIITEEEEKDIAAIVELAEIRDFRPLLYVIPYTLVSNLLREVPVRDRAAPLSQEYMIEKLPRRHFDILEFNL